MAQSWMIMNQKKATHGVVEKLRLARSGEQFGGIIVVNHTRPFLVKAKFSLLPIRFPRLP